MMMAFVLTIGAQAQQDDGMDAMLAAMIAAKIHQDSIDTSSLVAVYNYECQTQDADGQAVTDRMKVCLQVGQHCTRSYPYRKFREDTEGYESLAYSLGEPCGRRIWKNGAQTVLLSQRWWCRTRFPYAL